MYDDQTVQIQRMELVDCRALDEIQAAFSVHLENDNVTVEGLQLHELNR